MPIRSINCTELALISYCSALAVLQAKIIHHARPPKPKRCLESPQMHTSSIPQIHLTALRGNLHRRALRSLLALDPAGLPLSCICRVLRLLGLLCALCG